MLVDVEEAATTTIDYGGGIEVGGASAEPTMTAGAADERIDVAPRGFIEISRATCGARTGR